MKTLLARAESVTPKGVGKSRFNTEQDIELALAWAHGVIQLTQVAHAYNIPTTNASQLYVRLAHALRAHLRKV